MGDRKNHRWWNRSKDNIITNIMWPFLNGQVVEAKYRGKPTLLNLTMAKYLRIFRTVTKLSRSALKTFKIKNSVGSECTGELITETKLDKAAAGARSLLQKIVLPPKHQIFVVMKFGDDSLDAIYKDAIRPVGEEFHYHMLRIDEVKNSGRITDQILEAIAESEIVLSDLTGERPNCYFETGVASATGRELILTIRKGEKIHFDLKQNRFIKWKNGNELKDQLRKRLEDICNR